VEIQYDTAVTLDLIFEWFWLPLKGISIEINIHKQIYTISITFTQKIWGFTKDRFCHSGVIDTAVTKIVDFIVDFLREFEAIFKKALPVYQWPRESCLMKKNQRSKISCQGPFKTDTGSC
jgi:hypothetical protein